LLRLVSERLPEGVTLKSYGRNGYRVSGGRNKPNEIRRFLSEQGLLGKKSWEKFLPECLCFSNFETRLELLRGMMDTDGGVFKHRSGNCRVQYYSTSKELANGVRHLVQTLGGTGVIRKREHEEEGHLLNGKMIVHRRPSYVVDIVTPLNPFKMKEKASKFYPMVPKRMISKIEYVGNKRCQCIRVDAEDSLYLTEHCIVTHNTFDDSVCIFDEAQNATKAQLKLFLTRFGENSKIIITGDPKQSDLYNISGDVALVDIVNRLETLNGIGIVRFKNESIVRNPLVGAIIEKLEE